MHRFTYALSFNKHLKSGDNFPKMYSMLKILDKASTSKWSHNSSRWITEWILSRIF